MSMDQNIKPARAPAGTPVAHDADRFRLLYSNGRPVIPEDYCEPLQITTIRQLVGARVRAATTSAEPELPNVVETELRPS
jgi:hypothetical protein